MADCACVKKLASLPSRFATWVSTAGLDELAQLATAVGAIGIFLAWRTYRHTVSANRESHMSTLFRDYLQMGFAFHNDQKNRSEDDPSDKAYGYLADYKMWVMEEIWRWLETMRMESPVWSALEKAKLLPRFVASRRRLVKNWEATIIYQFHRDENDTLWQVTNTSWACYHQKFVDFVKEWHPMSPVHHEKHAGCGDCAKRGHTNAE